MEGVCNSSLTFIPLSSCMFIMEGSGSFTSNYFNSLTTWFEFFWSVILSSCYSKILQVPDLELCYGFNSIFHFVVQLKTNAF